MNPFSVHAGLDVWVEVTQGQKGDAQLLMSVRRTPHSFRLTLCRRCATKISSDFIRLGR